LRKKKILFISNEALLSGAPLCLEKILQYLKFNFKLSDKIIVHIPYSKGPLIERIEALGFEVVAFSKFTYSSNIFNKILTRLIYYFRYTFLLLRIQPILIYSNTVTNYSQVILGRIVGVKTLVHIHEGEQFFLKKLRNIKIASFFTTDFIVVSNYVGQTLLKYTNRKSNTIYNGVKIPTQKSRTFSRQSNSINIGIIGTIDRNKAQLIAIKAIEVVQKKYKKNVSLKIIGNIKDDVYYSELSDYILKYELDDIVQFSGIINDIDEIYNNLEIVTVCSYDEAFPLVNIEAMSYGKILIATRTGGNNEAIVHSQNGFLFEKGNHLELASIMIKVIEDSQLSKQISQNAIRRVQNRFLLEEFNQSIIKKISSFLT
jgi:glycosyltransferase involved in cell wall biosynthesis